MLNPQDIHRKAEEARLKENKRQSRRNKGRSGKRFFPLAPESRTVFHRIYPHSPNFFITMLLPLMAFTAGLVLWWIDKKNYGLLMPWLWTLPAIPVITWLIYAIREMMDYSHYKTWRETLRFPVHGWDYLGQSPHFPQWKFWDRNTILQVNLKQNSDHATHKLVTDMLYLCTIEANGTFYEADQVQPGAAGDLRYRWQTTGDLEISGSANSSVIGELYLFIDKQLRAVQLQTNMLESVTIRFSKNILEVQPVQTSD